MDDNKVRLLLIQANPPGTMVLDTDLEERKLQEALRRGQQRDYFAHPARLSAARISDLSSELRAHQPHILHFMGHGDGTGGLLLNAPDDQSEMVLPAIDLAALLAAYQAEVATPLQLVVLAGCHTAGAAALLVAHVSCVIAVAGDIEDTAVRDILTPEFYAALSDGRSIGNAVVSAQSAMGAHGFPVAAALVHAYARPGLDPATMRPRDWLQRHPPLTPLHLDYLRSWFGQPWTTVSLADLQRERQDQANLLDLYVPLPVDFTLVVKTADHRITDWWVKQAVLGEGQNGQSAGKVPEDLFSPEKLTKLRRWSDLGVGEEELQAIVEGIQQKITARQAAGTKTEDGEHNWFMEAHDAASVQPRFVLLGDPGSGKSSFLRHLTLCLAGELRRRAGDTTTPVNANLAALRDWLLGAYTPIYLEMRLLVRDLFPTLPADPNHAPQWPTVQVFWDYVRTHLLGPGLAGFESDLRTLVSSGQAILLLDGLDEIPQADDPRRRAQVKTFVAAVAQTYPTLRIIVGSRPYAYQAGDWQLAGFGHTRLQPLDMERLHELAVAIFTAAALAKPADEAAVFVKALAKHPHMEPSLHANPLFFTLLAALWLAHPERRLPATQAELYRAAVDLMLERWTRRRDPELSVADHLGVTATQLRHVLESLACSVHERRQVSEDTTAFPIGQLLELFDEANFNVRVKDIRHYLERHAGLLVAPEPRHFRFSHRSFQEHLAACALTCREPTQRRPLLAPERYFPQGLIQRVQAQPALWENVALLAADELVAQAREYELWTLLHGFCRPYSQAGMVAGSAMLALKLAQRHNLFAEIGKDDLRYPFLEPLRQAALRVLTDSNNFPNPADRNLAGELLGRHSEHDTRQGVGRRPDGLPDIDWVMIPETNAQGQREFIYQQNERHTEPTFWIARYPITYSQFQVFLDADDGFVNPVWWVGLSASADERAAPGEQRFKFWNHPRENVSWYEAMAFCRWLTAQAQARPDLLPLALQGQSGWHITLPTEWQWEKAARGHDGRHYPWGEKYQVGYANINETYQNAGPHYLQKTSAVGMYPHGASPYGVLDMSGNVWELCLNEYGEPARTQAEGDARRVVRGGSWSLNSSFASALYRSRWRVRGNFDGFRVVVGFVVPVA